MSDFTPNLPTDPSTPPKPAGSRRRIWLFRLIAAVGLPTLLLGLVELGLRIAGFGHDPNYFAPVPGRDEVMGNPRFGWTYFPPAIARVPELFNFPRTKPANTYRVFILGSSAAQGFPDPAYSFGRMLDVMLHERFPGARFEVINTAMVAINSHVVARIARDCLDQSPDLLVVYEGNNEVVGPFGPGTIFGGFSTSRTYTRASLAVRATRLGQAVARLPALFASGKTTPQVWKGMEFFLENPVRADDPRLETTRVQFTENLADICRSANAAHVPVVLCTVGVNLFDCAPFASFHPPGWAGSELAAWEDAYKAGVAAQQAGDFAAAVGHYQRAAERDAGFADLQYRLAQCLERTGRREEALAAFKKARDLDALRFRTDGPLNEAVRRVAAGFPSDRVGLADYEKLLDDRARAGGEPPGADFFVEHCHMTFRGNYELARVALEAAEKLLTPCVGRAPADAPVPPIETVAAALAYSAFDEEKVLSDVTKLVSRPPFTNQLDHAESLAAAEGRAAAAKAALTREALANSAALYAAAVRKRPADLLLKHSYANVLSALGDFAAAQAPLKEVLAAQPFNVRASIELAGALSRVGRADEAVAQLTAATKSPYCNAGIESELRFNAGVSQAQAGRRDAAVAEYRRAIALNPRNIKANTNLALLLDQLGQTAEAQACYERAIEIDDQYPIGHFNLGLFHFKRQEYGAALARFERAFALDPKELTNRLLLGESLVRLGRLVDAEKVFRAAVTDVPRSPDARNGLGSVLLALGALEPAIAEFEQALALRPDFTAARKNLEAAQAKLRAGR